MQWIGPRLVFFFGSICLGGTAAAQAPPADSAISSLTAMWKKKQETATAIRYQLSGKWVVFPPESSAIDARPGKTPRSFTIERRLLIDWPSGRYRNETKSQTDAGYDKSIQVYTGEVVKGTREKLQTNGDPVPGSEAKFGIGKGSLKHGLFTSEMWPIFLATGLLPATPKDGFYPGHLKYSVVVDMFYVRGTERVDGRQCTVLRTFPLGSDKAFYEYVVDPGRDGIILRATRFIGERQRFFNLTVRYQNTDVGGAIALIRSTSGQNDRWGSEPCLKLGV